MLSINIAYIINTMQIGNNNIHVRAKQLKFYSEVKRYLLQCHGELPKCEIITNQKKDIHVYYLGEFTVNFSRFCHSDGMNV